MVQNLFNFHSPGAGAAGAGLVSCKRAGATKTKRFNTKNQRAEIMAELITVVHHKREDRLLFCSIFLSVWRAAWLLLPHLSRASPYGATEITKVLITDIIPYIILQIYSSIQACTFILCNVYNDRGGIII